MVELKDWIHLEFSLHVSNTWFIMPVISGNLDSIIVTHDDNVVVLTHYNKCNKFIKPTNPSFNMNRTFNKK
jgi:hypothetical protein